MPCTYCWQFAESGIVEWLIPLWPPSSQLARGAIRRVAVIQMSLRNMVASERGFGKGITEVYQRLQGNGEVVSLSKARPKIAVISTGGTIEKTYDEMAGVLQNAVTVLDIMLESLSLNGVELVRVPLMNKDSTEMSVADHTIIAEMARAMSEQYDGVVVVHGTDRLSRSGEQTFELTAPKPRVPIIFTGAMRPYLLRTTDAVQNLTEALLAVQLVPPGVYVVMHSTVLAFPGVVKDISRGQFVKQMSPAPDKPL